MAVSTKIEGMITQSSWIRKMFEDGIRLKQQFGAENVFDFSLGNPNVPPPRELLKALIEVAKDERPGVHAYMPNAGFPETRADVESKLRRDHGVSIDADNVIRVITWVTWDAEPGVELGYNIGQGICPHRGLPRQGLRRAGDGHDPLQGLISSIAGPGPPPCRDPPRPCG